MRRNNLLAGIALASMSAVLLPSLAVAQQAQNQVTPLQGRISPFQGRISPFGGDVNPFWGRISPFSGSTDTFWGDMSPFSGDITRFWGSSVNYSSANATFYVQAADFWSKTGPSMNNVFTAWQRVDTSPNGVAAFRSSVQDLINQSQTFWAGAVRSQTGQNFQNGFVAPLLADYGINLNNANTFDDFSDVQRAQFLFAWYDGLMDFSGRDHVDYWMATSRWSPALSQSAGAGSGVTIGLMDFNPANVHTTRTDQGLTGALGLTNSNIDTASNHGAAVASILVAPIDGQGLMGIAPSARIAEYDPFDATGSASWDDVAAGMRSLRSSGAGVVNLSLGQAGFTLAPQWARLYSDPLLVSLFTGTVYVHAAGNDGLAQTANINWNFALDPAILVVGSIGPNDVISPFSNTPGSACLMSNGVCREPLMNRFLVAPGEWVLTSDGNGGYVRQSGTSFAAPMVTGAVALLQSRWPWLKKYPHETADILLDTARDLGAPGVDPVYGHGALDITASQGPINVSRLYQTTTLGSRIAFSTSADSRTIAMMGAKDAYTTAYEDIGTTYRDFRVPLQGKLSSGNALTLMSAYTALQRATSGLLSVGTKFTGDDVSAPVRNAFGWDVQMSLSPLPMGQDAHDGALPFAVDTTISGGRGVTLDFGHGYGAAALSNATAFQSGSATLTNEGPDPLLALASGGGYVSARFALAPNVSIATGFTQHSARAFVPNPISGEEKPIFPLFTPFAASAMNAVIKDDLNDQFSLSASYTYLREQNSVLGIQSSNPDDLRNGSETDAATFTAGWTLSPRVSLAIAATYGRIRPSDSNQSLRISDAGAAVSAFEFAARFSDVFAQHDAASIRFGQPMRIVSGNLNVTDIEVTNRNDGTLGAVTHSTSLGDGGPQYFVEGAYARTLPGNHAEVAALVRIDSDANGGADEFVGGRLAFHF